jgi:hypothetical protein
MIGDVTMTRSSGAVLLSLVLTACGSGISTNSDYDPSTDFSAFQTYNWIPAGNGMDDGAGVAGNQLIDGRIRTAIEANLNAKGLTKASGGQADISVGYQITAQDRVQYNTVSTGWGGGYGGYYGGWGGMGMTMGSSTTYATNYTDGTLIIGIFENSEKKMVWQGTATKTIDESLDAEERTQSINEAVAKTMADFPPNTN